MTSASADAGGASVGEGAYAGGDGGDGVLRRGRLEG